MKILQIGNTDLVGNRFNGFELHKMATEKVVDSHYYVWEKESSDPQTSLIATSKISHRIKLKIDNIEAKLSIQSLLYPAAFKLLFNKRFREADLIHYHLIHTGYFSIASLPFLSRAKPAIWTLHDPWPLTGHCIHPYDCNRWQIGCGQCPNLETPLSMQKDNTAFMWKVKEKVYKYSQIELVVASKWMLNMVEKSPLLSKHKVHYIPFGLDLKIFRPSDITLAKASLGIPDNTISICFRATKNEFKGLLFIKECLRKIDSKQPICLITFQESGLLDEFKEKFKIIDLGWVNDTSIIVNAYNASDIFLMPSTAETFGMMAIEAMACGKPVITFDGTSLRDVIFAPEGGMSVPKGDIDAFLKELTMLIDNREARDKLGKKALNLANEHYNIEDQYDKTYALYEDVIARRAYKN